MFQKLSLKMKLLLSFALIVSFLVGVGITALVSINKVDTTYRHVPEVNFPNAVYLAAIRGAQKDIVIAVSTLLGTTATQDDVNEQLKNLEAAIKAHDQAAKSYEDVPFVEGEQEKWDKVADSWKPFIEMSRKLIEMSRSGRKEDNDQRDKLGNTEFQSLRQDFLQKLDVLIKFQEAESTKWSTQAQQTDALSRIVILIAIVSGTLLAGFVGFFLARSLSATLSSISQQLLHGADSVSKAAVEISSSSTEFSSSTTQQAAALQQTVSAIDEVNAMVGKNSENAIKSKQTADISLQAAGKGQRVVNSMIQSIDEINTSNGEIMKQIESSNLQMSEIVQVIAEISNKTKVINDIVFQTKLLSFNASVEAARAGEHGKGFAVVAEEVGNLAQMSGNAAREIFDMLGASSQKVEKIVNETKTSVERLIQTGKEKVENGSKTAQSCGEVLEEIVKNVSHLAEMVNEISQASQEQAKGVQEITQSIQQMDQTTQQNATATQQTSSAAEALSNQALSLNQVAKILMVTIQGGGADVPGEKAEEELVLENDVQRRAA